MVWIEDHSLYRVFTQYLPAPTTRSERGLWARLLSEMGAAEASPAQVHQFIKLYREQHPDPRALTIMAVLRNWTAVLKGNPHGAAQRTVVDVRGETPQEYAERGRRWRDALIAAALAEPAPE